MALGLGLIVVLLAVVATSANRALSLANRGFSQYRDLARHSGMASQFQTHTLMMTSRVKDFILLGEPKQLEEYQRCMDLLNGDLRKAQAEITDPDAAARVQAMAKLLGEYDQAFQKMVQLRRRRDEILSQSLGRLGPQGERQLTDLMTSAYGEGDPQQTYQFSLAMRQLMLGRFNLAKFLNGGPSQDAQNAALELTNHVETLERLLAGTLADPARRQAVQELAEVGRQYLSSLLDLERVVTQRRDLENQELNRLGPEIANQAEALKAVVQQRQDSLGPQLAQANQTVALLILAISLGAALLAVGVGMVLERSVSRPFRRIFRGLGKLTTAELYRVECELHRVIAGLSEGGKILAFSSQHIADGSTNQSASLQQARANLEEVSSMAKANAGHADQIQSLVKNSNQRARLASASMNELTASMAEITRASDQIAGIIKTIDGIAFQTNLLALNAAVEAARAGEAGAGFAVVAGEVRRLAGRAAQAARDTAGLIQTTVEKIKAGDGQLSEANQNFSEMAHTSGQVGELVELITAAIQGQTVGLEEVSQAIAEIDRMVEYNADNNQNLSGQAEEITGMVGILVKVVHGADGPPPVREGYAVQAALFPEIAGGLSKDETNASREDGDLEMFEESFPDNLAAQAQAQGCRDQFFCSDPEAAGRDAA